MECYKRHFFDMDKEEQWLNEMAEKGMVLTKIGGGIFMQKYYFEKSDTAYTYRVDYSRDGAVMEEITAPYVMFVTSSCDAEYVCYSDGKVYFRRAKEKGDFPKLYSDPKSRYEAEQKQLGGSVGLMGLFVFDFCYVGNFVITAVKEGRSDWIIVLEAICILICAVCLFLTIRKAISCCRKMKELKQMMKE